MALPLRERPTTRRDSLLLAFQGMIDEGNRWVLPSGGGAPTSHMESGAVFMDNVPLSEWPDTRKVLRELNNMVAEGLVRRHGGPTYAYWSLTEAGMKAIQR